VLRALGELKEEISRTEEHLDAEILSAILEEVHTPYRNELIPPFSIIDDDLVDLMLVSKAWQRTVLRFILGAFATYLHGTNLAISAAEYGYQPEFLAYAERNQGTYRHNGLRPNVIFVKKTMKL
jgi:hypothetical protein